VGLKSLPNQAIQRMRLRRIADLSVMPSTHAMNTCETAYHRVTATLAFRSARWGHLCVVVPPPLPSQWR
jgi:hypothetical protein